MRFPIPSRVLAPPGLQITNCRNFSHLYFWPLRESKKEQLFLPCPLFKKKENTPLPSVFPLMAPLFSLPHRRVTKSVPRRNNRVCSDSNASMHQNYQEDLLKQAMAGLHPRDPDSVGLGGGGLGICNSKRFPSGFRTTLENILA